MIKALKRLFFNSILAVQVLVSSCQPAPQNYVILPNFESPKEFYTVHDYLPVEYLDALEKSIKVKGQTGFEKLSKLEKENLKQLFIDASRASMKKYNQTYLFNRNTSLVKMLAEKYLEINELSFEPGGDIRLSDIERILTR